MSLFSVVTWRSYFNFSDRILFRSIFALLVISSLSVFVTSCGGGRGGGSEYYNRGYRYGREYADQTVMLHINTSQYYKADHYLSRSFAERMLDAYKSSLASFQMESYEAEQEWDNGFVNGYMDRANELVKGYSSGSDSSYSSSSSESSSSSKGLGFKGWCIIIGIGYIAYKYLKSKNKTESNNSKSGGDPINIAGKPEAENKSDITHPVEVDSQISKAPTPIIVEFEKQSSEEPLTYSVQIISESPIKKIESQETGSINDKKEHTQIYYIEQTSVSNDIHNNDVQIEEFAERDIIVNPTLDIETNPKGNKDNVDIELPQPEIGESEVSEEDCSGELPVYEENENIGKGSSWIVWMIVLLLLGGGVLATGQFLNWWNISALSWIGKTAGSNEAIVAVDSDTIVEEVPEVVEIAPEVAVGHEMKILKGYIGGKYAVEMILSGESLKEGTAHYFTPQTGKYRYTKNNGAWIDISVEVETDSHGVDLIKLKEYTDGSLTGTWNVKYDAYNDRLTGEMTNYKGDKYSVKLSTEESPVHESAGLDEGYNKIAGNVITNSKDFPFYIDFKYQNGSITNAVYHNPDYNTTYNLPTGRISNGEYYFEGDHNGSTMIIKFSATGPCKGTIKVGSNIRNIEMDL